MNLPCPGERAALEAGRSGTVQCALCPALVPDGEQIKGRNGWLCENCADLEYPKQDSPSFLKAVSQ